jgi:hypothetical protein
MLVLLSLARSVVRRNQPPRIPPSLTPLYVMQDVRKRGLIEVRMSMEPTVSTSCGINASYLGSSDMATSSHTYEAAWQDFFDGFANTPKQAVAGAQFTLAKACYRLCRPFLWLARHFAHDALWEHGNVSPQRACSLPATT